MNLALFFTYGTSLVDWNNNGSLDREINIYRKLAPHFTTIYFLTYGYDDAQYADKFPKNIVILPRKMRVPLVVYSVMIPFLYQKQLRSCNWLKTNQMLGSWSAVIAKWLFRKKLLLRTGYTESLSFVDKGICRKMITTLIERIAYMVADKSIVTSEHQKEYIQKKYGITNIQIIPNGIDTDSFRPPVAKKPSEKNTQLLFIGRLHPEKNLINLLKAMVGLENIRLRIIGSGPLKKEIISFSEKNSLFVEIINNVPNNHLPEQYAQADIYVQPSLYEGNPKTILEAMSCGLPVISTDVQGIQNIIQHQKNGYLCTIKPNSIRVAIEELAKNTNLREKLSKNARQHILSNYDILHMIQSEVRLYQA